MVQTFEYWKSNAVSIAHLDQALREAEERHDAAVATMHAYLRLWLAEHGGPLLVSQDALRNAASGPPLKFEIDEDGETLRISEGEGTRK
jgi:hypothetical protein